MLENIVIGITTGIISGAYTGLIISKYILFTSLRREALRIIRRIEYVSGKGYSKTESLPEILLISSDLLSLNHKKAGGITMQVFEEVNKETSSSSANINEHVLYKSQEVLRHLPANILVLINPFSIKV